MSAARRKPELHLVGKETEPTTEQALRRCFADRAEVAAVLQDIDDAIAILGRRIATKRGVAFIRVEQLRQEFGGQR